MTHAAKIIDQFGFPIRTAALAGGSLQNRRIAASYDAARTTTENRNIWANADNFDADSAHSRDVRQKLVARSRYEVANNGYSDGIAQTYSTDLVGLGPALRMQTKNAEFNRKVELAWYRWAKAIQFRRKLWCAAHAKFVDGEAIGVIRHNPRVRHNVKLDVVLYETEQCQTPYLPFNEPGYIDGIRFDEFGNPLWYDILHQHPGTTRSLLIDQEPERVPAEMVLHWFKLRRPGQHRGVPECASTLNVGAAGRRFREATLAAADTAADLNVLLKTPLPPDGIGSDDIVPFDEIDIHKRMMTVLPYGTEGQHMKSEHPNAAYSEFHKTLINEQARPKSMPYNKAACDSSSYNYASGRLDHQTYYAALDVEREDCNDTFIDPLFDVWFALAVEKNGWLGGDSSRISEEQTEHLWDWPKHRVADVEAEANSNQTRLKSGQVTLHRLYSDAGLDLQDEIEKSAESFGVSPDEMRRRILNVILPEPTKPAAQSSPPVNGSRFNGHSLVPMG